MRRVRIRMTDSIAGTVVTDLATGQDLTGLVSVTITHRAGQPPLAELTELVAVGSVEAEDISAELWQRANEHLATTIADAIYEQHFAPRKPE